MRRIAVMLVALPMLVPAAGCGGSGGGGGDADLTIYSGRSEKLIGDLIKDFEKRSGLDVEVRYGDSAELAAQIAEEGDNSPADVFFAQDAGALGSVEGQLAPLPQDVLARAPERYRDDTGRWVGASARARVVAYHSRKLDPAKLPDTILAFTGPEWKGRIGIAPTNASFQAFVSAMRLDIGDDATRKWLDGIKANEPKTYEGNVQVEEAIAKGEVDVGFVNHYYAYELKAEQPGFPVENHFLKGGDPGALVNVAGPGVLASSDSKENAHKFVRHLLSPEGQAYFVEKEWEYPVVDGVAAPEGLPPLAELQGPKIKLEELGGKLRSTLEMLDQARLTS
jgi:iron(III) transport system substrate-binding protein